MTTKKCTYCSEPIDVHKGNYINLYKEPFQQESWHTGCFVYYAQNDPVNIEYVHDHYKVEESR